MRIIQSCWLVITLMTTGACISSHKKEPAPAPIDSATVGPAFNPADTAIFEKPANDSIEIASYEIMPDSLVAFARTLQGVPYLYASIDPAKGFDCSGFITYVFNHFNTKVPRSSVDFTNYGQEMPFETAAPGDLILFTGTDSTIRVVGHMGIVDHWQNDTMFFIQSTSGKNKGVVITPFEKYYRSRFVKITRVLPATYFH